jgi:hypothetical protein
VSTILEIEITFNKLTDRTHTGHRSNYPAEEEEEERHILYGRQDSRREKKKEKNKTSICVFSFLVSFPKPCDEFRSKKEK